MLCLEALLDEVSCPGQPGSRPALKLQGGGGAGDEQLRGVPRGLLHCNVRGSSAGIPWGPPAGGGASALAGAAVVCWVMWLACALSW